MATGFDRMRNHYVKTGPGTFVPVQRGRARSHGLELNGLVDCDSEIDLMPHYDRSLQGSRGWQRSTESRINLFRYGQHLQDTGLHSWGCDGRLRLRKVSDRDEHQQSSRSQPVRLLRPVRHDVCAVVECRTVVGPIAHPWPRGGFRSAEQLNSIRTAWPSR